MTASPESIVVRYAGAQISNTRELIRVRFDAQPQRRIPGELWNRGFRRQEDGSYTKRHTPGAIVEAQAILNPHYEVQP